MRDVISIKLCNKRIREYNPIRPWVPKRGPRVALFYPAPYEVASQSLGFQLVYALLASYGIVVERFTSDSCGLSLETGTPVTKFDFILASSSFELDYVHLADFLKRYAKEHTVIAGGLSPTANPIPLLDMVDYVALGDAEATIPELAQMFHEGELEPREWLVNRESDGGARRWADISEEPILASQFVPLDIEPPWGRGFLIEVTRGCPHKCRFCLEGWTNKPFRERDLKLVSKTLEGVGEPFEKVITISLSLTDYKKYKEYLRILSSLELEGSVPSLRLDGIDEETVELIKEIGQRTVTVAPETTLPSKVAILGKGFPLETVERVADLVSKAGLKTKVYVMVVPGEDLETAKLETENLRRAFGKGAHFTVNPLIPKPWTPLQIAPIPGEREEKTLLYYKKRLPNADLYPVRWARLQALLSLSPIPLMRYLDPGLSPSKQFRELFKVINRKELLQWRPNWDPPWMRFEISEEREVKELGARSFEAWRRAFSASQT